MIPAGIATLIIIGGTCLACTLFKGGNPSSRELELVVLGLREGEKCNRDGCEGTIESATFFAVYCPECGWQVRERV